MGKFFRDPKDDPRLRPVGYVKTNPQLKQVKAPIGAPKLDPNLKQL